MTDRFLGTWTLRGVFDVGSDIFLLPGDKFRVDKTNGKYQIVMLEGDKRWSSAVDLAKKNPGDTLFDRSKLQPRNSVELTQNSRESRYVEVLRPEWTAILAAGACTFITGPVPDIGAEVELYVGYDDGCKEEVIIVRVKHGGGSQNGTAHGDRPQ